MMTSRDLVVNSFRLRKELTKINLIEDITINNLNEYARVSSYQMVLVVSIG